MSGEPRTVAIVGLGLIGGSLARDLAAAGVRILGRDRDQETVEDAIRSGAVSAALPEELAGVEAADALVIALPVDAAAHWLAEHAHRIARIPLVMDTGSTKAGIVAVAERVGVGRRFVGAHPLAGDHRSGWGASRRGLFADAPVYICTTEEIAPHVLRKARALWGSVGARPLQMDAGAHDRQLAWTSHLPQAVSTALACAFAEAGIPAEQLGPGGAGMTRLAASSPEMWSGILTENSDEVAPALARLEAAITGLRQALESNDRAAVSSALSAGRTWAGGRAGEPLEG